MPEAIPPYRFGDLLALARRSWTLQMAEELAQHGYGDYRITDAATLRLLMHSPVAVGRLGEVLGVSRQAARKVARGLEQRGYATAEPDADDARRVNVSLTDRGMAYARAVVAVIALLNRRLADQVDQGQLLAADSVLRAAITQERVRRSAGRIPPPPGLGGPAT